MSKFTIPYPAPRQHEPFGLPPHGSGGPVQDEAVEEAGSYSLWELFALTGWAGARPAH
ncbi:hypothetical protein [Streptomyces sp. NBC_00454]|uniref:hypothetical protein n=1 Tax=Streptomyces sp. NBC_00454 TaxID=2975747 RepID=UPI0030E4CFFA